MWCVWQSWLPAALILCRMRHCWFMFWDHALSGWPLTWPDLTTVAGRRSGRVPKDLGFYYRVAVWAMVPWCETDLWFWNGSWSRLDVTAWEIARSRLLDLPISFFFTSEKHTVHVYLWNIVFFFLPSPLWIMLFFLLLVLFESITRGCLVLRHHPCHSCGGHNYFSHCFGWWVVLGSNIFYIAKLAAFLSH